MAYGQIKNVVNHRKVKTDHDLYEVLEGETKSMVLFEGDYRERHFAICRAGLGHPTAYIEVKEDDFIARIPEEEIGKYCTRYDMWDGDVHGGPTYYGKAWWNEADERQYLGWDYAHAGYWDPNWFDHDENEVKWGTMEILCDVIGAIVQTEYMNTTRTEWWKSKKDETEKTAE